MNEKMLAKFTDICFNRLQTIENFVMQIENGNENADDMVVLMRELHTLKGESRIMNLIEMSDVVHVIEDAMLWRNESEYEAPDAFYNLLYQGLDILRNMCTDGLTHIAQHHLDNATTYIGTLTEWLANPDASIETIETVESRSPSTIKEIPQEITPEATSTEPPETPMESIEIRAIQRLRAILQQAQQAPLSEEELNSIHPLLYALVDLAPEGPVRDLTEAFHFVIAWIYEQVFMVEDEAFFIVGDGLDFLEALFLDQVPDVEETVGGFLGQMGEWVESNIAEPPTIPALEDLEIPLSIQQLGHTEDDQASRESDVQEDEEPVETSEPVETTAPIEPKIPDNDVVTEQAHSPQPSTPTPSNGLRKKNTNMNSPSTVDNVERKEKKIEPAFIQIEIEQVEALTHISGELQLHQAQIEKVSKDLDRLTKDWTHLVQTEIIQQKRSQNTTGQASPFLGQWIKMQALAKEFAVHLNQLREGVLVSNVNLEDFQHRIGEIRLQKIGELFHRFPRSIRDLAKEQGKKIQVILEGVDVSIDKTVIEALFDPMLHLVRNGVDHGIELPDERVQSGKPEKSTLTLSAERYGDSVKISIRDDGRGIDPERIRETLYRKQLMNDIEIQSMSEHQLIQQIFRPGFSTQKTVSHISGRGVGLDVVKSIVEKLSGNIVIDSTIGVGTTFNLTLPISVALTYALLVRIHEGYFAFPIQSVEKILQIHRDEVITVGEGEAARMDDGTLLPIVGLGSVLEFGETLNSNKIDNIVLLQSANSKVCVRVDSILGVRQLVQANLPSFIRDLRIISGTAMIEGGMVVQFLNVMYLLDLAIEHRKRTDAGTKRKKQSSITRILIAEDSDLTREMLVSRVSRMGYQVFEAVNGQDALEQLDYREVDLVMTDLDMPILNGFELIRKLRSNRRTENLPIVVLSTRRTKESKQQAAQAGADAYIVKSAYNEEELQNTFQRLLTP